MAKLPFPPLSSYPWYVRLFFFFQNKKYGGVLEPTRFWALSPNVFGSFLRMRRALERRRSPLSAELRALLMLRVSQLNECAFCIDMHIWLALKKVQAKDRIDELAHFRESPHFSEKEKVALAYAEEMILKRGQVSDEIFTKLKGVCNANEIVEITATVGFQNLSTLFNTSLGVESFGFCKR